MSAAARSTKLGAKTKNNAGQPQLRGVVMDGVIFRSSSHASPSVNLEPKRSQAPAQKVHTVTRRSLTLMRDAVSRPKTIPSIKSDIKRKDKSTWRPTLQSYVAKASTNRLNRANKIKQHSKVSHFGGVSTSANNNIHKLTSKVTAVARPITNPIQTVAVPANGGIAMTRSFAAAAPAVLSHQKLEEMLDRALEQADSHKQELTGSLRRGFLGRLGRTKILSISLLLGLAIASGIGFAYLRVPAVAVKVASVRAGIKAKAPSYTPEGFSLASTSASPGDVSLKFKAPAASYTVSQQSSGLNSNSLKSSVVAPANSEYQTSQYNGVTVYTYTDKSTGSPSATWVNNGVRYTVSGQAVSNDQLLKIAQSIP